MDIKQALNILRPQGNSLDDLKAAYRQACKRYHPDVNPNGLEIMKLINCAYEFLKQHINKWSASQATNDKGIDKIFDEILKGLRHIPELHFEVCGVWLWVTGDTKPVKEILKEKGFKFSGKKVAWYWHEEGYRKLSRHTWSLDEIRAMFGSTEIDSETLDSIAA